MKRTPGLTRWALTFRRCVFQFSGNMTKLFGNKMERWVHTQFHKIEAETGIDADDVAEIIEMYLDAMDAELTNEKDEALFATLSDIDGAATDDQFLKNLSQWIAKYTGNVNVAQRLNILVIKLQDDIRKSWNII